MSNIINTFKMLFAGAAAGISAAIGGFDTMIFTFVALVTLDYITGLIAGFVTKTVSSRTGFKGLLKKVCILLVVAVAIIIDEMAGAQHVLRDAVCVFYIVNEGISTLENLHRAGIPFPAALSGFFEQMKKQNPAGKIENPAGETGKTDITKDGIE